MNIHEIFTAGGIQVPNPRYSESTKDTEPQFITTTDIHQAADIPVSGLARIAYDAIGQGRSGIIGKTKDYQKYIDYGITPTIWNSNLDKQLADAQSNWEKAGNALIQTLGAELLVGIPKGFSDLIDIAISALPGQELGDYSNPVSQYLEEVQESIRKAAPIYTTPGVNIANGGLTDASWWFSNAPSIVSSLILMIPGAAVVKGASALGKLAKVNRLVAHARRNWTGAQKAIEAGKKLNWFQKAANNSVVVDITKDFAKAGMMGVMSRASENYQEARQTFNEIHNEAIVRFANMSDEEFSRVTEANANILKKKNVDPSNKEAVSKALAEEAADVTFAMDWANVAFDVWQMYAMRGLFKGKIGSDVGGSAVRKAQRNSMRYAGKTTQEIADSEAKRGWFRKTARWGTDKAQSLGTYIWSSLSEGVEEGINYISSQEGLNYGTNLINGIYKDRDLNTWKNIADGFDTRLNNYLAAPELYDAAFWGVLGGVVFNAGGKKLRQVYHTLHDKPSQANEQAKKTDPLNFLNELPQNKAAITVIESRKALLDNVIKGLERINNGVDIYNSSPDEDVMFGELSSEEDKQIARERLLRDWAQHLGLAHSRSGTFDLLAEYLKNDNVIDAMIKGGIVDASTIDGDPKTVARDYANQILREAQEAADIYNNELLNVSTQAIAIDPKEVGENIPIEYLQIIAMNNTKNKLVLKDIKTELNSVNSQITNLQNDVAIADQVDINDIEYIRLGILSQKLGKARAERKRLAKQNSISAQIGIENIDKEIAAIESLISPNSAITGITPVSNHAKLLYSTYTSLMYEYADDTATDVTFNPFSAEAVAYRDAVLAGNMSKLSDLKLLNLSDEVLRSMTDAEVGEYLAFESRIDQSFIDIQSSRDNMRRIDELAKDAEKRVTRLNSRLYNLYDRANQLEIGQATALKMINRTTAELSKELVALHNNIDNARKTAIEGAKDNIQEIYEKYGEQVIEYTKKKAGLDNTFTRNTQNPISSADMRKLDENLDVLALSNPNNQYLALVLEDLFLDSDTNTLRDTQEAEQINITLSEAELDNTSSNQEETSPALFEANTSQILPQIEALSNTNLLGYKPNFYARPSSLLSTTNQVISSDIQTDEHIVAFYEQSDRTYIVDPRNSIATMLDRDLFDRDISSSIDNSVIASFPIVKLNSDNTVSIIEKGKIISKDDSNAQQFINRREDEYNELNSQQSNDAIYDVTQEAEMNLDDLNDNDSNQSYNHISSTGERATQEATLQSESTVNSVHENSLGLHFDPDDSFYDTISKAYNMKKEYQTRGEEEFDKFLTEIKQAALVYDFDEAYIDKQINSIRNRIKRAIARESKQTLNTLDNIDEAVFQSTIVEYSPNSENVSNYLTALKTMLNDYIISNNTDSIDNKYYINLEHLLRWTNQIAEDSTTAELLYNNIVKYIKSIGDNNYIIINSDESLNSREVLLNASKTEAERIAELEKDRIDPRVDIFSYVRDKNLTAKKKKEFYDALNTINVNDVLSFEITDKTIYLKDKKGRVVGTLKIPFVNHSNGRYASYNDGWKTEVSSINGKFTSPLKNRFLDLFIGKKPEYIEISKALYEYTYSRPTNERKKELIKTIGNSDFIKQARQDELVHEDATNEELIDGLAKLLKYTNEKVTNHNITGPIVLEQGLDHWFSKLYRSYHAIYNLSQNPNSTITVSKITEGELITVVDEYDRQNPQKLPSAKAGLVNPKTNKPGVNTEVHKIAIASVKNPGTVYMSGIGGYTFTRFAPQSTFVRIPDRGRGDTYVHAFPIRLSDGKNMSKTGQALVKSIRSRAETLIKNVIDNPSAENRGAVVKFFLDAFTIKEGRTPLLYDVHVNSTKERIVVNSRDNEWRITISKNGTIHLTSPKHEVNDKGYRTHTFNLKTEDNKKQAKKELTPILKTILDRSRFNIHETFVKSDNSDLVQLKGLASKREGKLVVTIDENTEFVFDSFNDFMLNNNLVRVNTKPREDNRSNFRSRGETNHLNNQIFTISIQDNSSTPVEDNDTSLSTPELTFQEYATNIINQLNTTQSIDALELFTQFFKDYVAKDDRNLDLNIDVLNKLVELNLLPKNLIFETDFETKYPDKPNAVSIIDKGETVIGNPWIELFTKNPGQAIRKLIHEQLHHRLHEEGNNKYITQIQEIYDEFKQALDNGLPGLSSIYSDRVNHYKAYLFKDYTENDVKLEEFLVESLTSNELARLLNEIKATGQKYQQGDKSLFQRILETLAKIFNWNVKEGSLYAKELSLLQDLVNTTPVVKPSEPNTPQTPINKTRHERKVRTRRSSITERIEVGEHADSNLESSNNSDFSSSINIYKSSIAEDPQITIISNITNTDVFTDSLPIPQKSKFISLLVAGDIKMLC